MYVYLGADVRGVAARRVAEGRPLGSYDDGPVEAVWSGVHVRRDRAGEGIRDDRLAAEVADDGAADLLRVGVEAVLSCAADADGLLGVEPYVDAAGLHCALQFAHVEGGAVVGTLVLERHVDALSGRRVHYERLVGGCDSGIGRHEGYLVSGCGVRNVNGANGEVVRRRS